MLLQGMDFKDAQDRSGIYIHVRVQVTGITLECAHAHLLLTTVSSGNGAPCRQVETAG